ncbi:unnamed protein product [Mytilus edulis]|uniref:SGNH hydrolase-type esterase domain-containing protein n=1 Tax=Mytilus edulis TaxID=6550 RepID=A0A8S3TJU7_MYTED|nr:unnamed protein product [Mytilus edulis]
MIRLAFYPMNYKKVVYSCLHKSGTCRGGKVENNEKETSDNEKGIQRDESTADSKSKQKNDVEKCKHDGKETNKSEKDDLTGLQNKIREQTEDIDNIKTVLHRIEQNQVDQDLKISFLKEICVEIKENVTKMSEKGSTHGELDEIIKTDQAKTKKKVEENKGEIRQNKINIEMLDSFVNEITSTVTRIADKANESLRNVETIGNKMTKLHDITIETIKEEISKTQKQDKEEMEQKDIELEMEEKTREKRMRKNSNDNSSSLDTSNKTQEIQAKTTNREHQQDKEQDLWIIGSSIIKDINSRRMYRNRAVKITTLYDKTIYGATQFLKSGKVKTKNVMFQIGSNDLDTKEAEEVLLEIEKLVDETKKILPKSTIVIGELLPRYYKDHRLSLKYENKRAVYNSIVKEFCNEKSIEFVTYANLKFIDFYDGVHASETGVKIMVSNMKKVLNTLLGIKIEGDVSENDNHRGKYYSNHGNGNRNFNNSFIDRRQYKDKTQDVRYQRYPYNDDTQLSWQGSHYSYNNETYKTLNNNYRYNNHNTN